jgi:uncharacterized protein YfaP (DUF2135 family)
MRGSIILFLSLALLVGVLLAQSAVVAEEPRAASLRITSPRGGQTRLRVVKIAGTVQGVDAERLTLVLNGVPLSIPRDGASFSTEQVLAPGPNTIRVIAEEKGGVVEDEVVVHAIVPPKNLRITLTWDTPGTDIDLWVTGPDGVKIYYQNKQGATGGTLDTDVTTGFGPETYTQARAVPGTYRVQAHYYGGGPPTRVTVTVVQGEGTPKERRDVLRAVLLKKDDVVQVGEYVIER